MPPRAYGGACPRGTGRKRRVKTMGRHAATDDEAAHQRPSRVPAAITRRGLFAGGMLSAAGVAGLVGADASPAAAPPSAGTIVYGPPPSMIPGDDDTPALFAAISAMTNGGTLVLPPGTYHLRTLLYVSSRVDLQGSGGGYAGTATVLQCMTAAAGVHVWGGGGVTGNFVVDGNSTATTPFTRGYEGSAVGRTFAALSVLNSAQDGVTCLGGQNDAWYLLTVQYAARDCLVLDQGYGGALFSKCEIATGGRFNLRIDRQVPGGPYAAPSDNVFHQCIIEYNQPGSQSIAYINGGWATKFDHTSFYASTKTTGPVIDVLGAATELTIEDAAIQSTGSTIGGLGLRVDFGTGVTLSGTTHFQNLDVAIYVRKSASAPAVKPWVDIQGLPLYYYCTKHVDGDAAALVPGMGFERYVSHAQVEPIQARRTAPDDAAYISRIGTDDYPAVVETAAGRRMWGAGGSAAVDVALGRRSAGVLGVDATNLFATGYGSTATRPAAAAAAAGALRLNTDANRLEVSDGSRWCAPSEHSASFTTSGTFVVPDGITAIRCRALGGGGGGGGAGNIGASSKSKSCYGGAGGGAGMLLEQLVAVTPGESLMVMVGAGGAGGTGAVVATGATGNFGQDGTPGAATTIARAGTSLVQAPGGGAGPGGPGASSSRAVAPGSAGAYGCADVSLDGSPGCGGFADRGVIPAVGGICGGAAGASSSATRGGGSGTAPTAPGQRGTVGTASAPSASGLAGAGPTAPGCGGNGGGAGGKGGTGGAGGSGSAGQLDLWWVS